MPLTSFSPDDSYQEMLSRYDTDGAIIIRDLVDSGTISAVVQAAQMQGTDFGAGFQLAPNCR